MSRYKLGDGTYSDQYKVGDKFTFAGLPYEANAGWTPEDLEGLFEFVFDDESFCPKFKSLVSGMEDYEEWCLLSKYTEVEPTKEDAQAYDSELEEAYAHIESLESALEDAVRELAQKDAEIQILKEVHSYNETLIKKLVTREYGQ